MRPGLLIENEDVRVDSIARSSSSVMTGLVPITHAVPLRQNGEKRPRSPGPAGRLCIIGVHGRDKPGHDGVGPTAESLR